MSGKLIVIEGVDGSGKATHTERIFQRLSREGKRVKKIEFPNYQSPSSSLIKMYLNGEFGTNPTDVNPYVASTFYAVDRFASYKKEWEGFYKNGGILLADRYTTSNMIHQGAKLADRVEKDKFLDWLWDFEFNIYGLPIPDGVIFLDMPPEYSMELMRDRANKYTAQVEKDIHEKNIDYISVSYKNACWVAAKYKWYRISCVEKEQIKPIEVINREIYSIIRNNIFSEE